MIEFSNVTHGYDGEPVLNDVSFRIEPGELVYLVGRSGVGKTTLLKLLYLDLLPSAGEVRVGEFSSRSIRPREIPLLRRRLGIVFQDFKLLPDRNVYDNVAFALHVTGTPTKDVRPRVLAALEEVGLTHKTGQMPHQLSGGEQQRVVIARALVNHPVVLLADEPTGNLDPTASRGIMELLQRINARGTAVLMATHDYGLVRRFPGRILQLLGGTIREVVLKSTGSAAGAIDGEAAE